MLVYLIRHGESEANATNTHSGWSPVNLTQKGREEAIRTGEMLKNTHFDRLIVSDVRRAQQTAALVFPDMPRTYCPLAREMNNTVMRGCTAAEMTARYGEMYLKCRSRMDYAPMLADCESGAHLYRRAGAFLRSLEAYDCERLAVVAHAGFIRACAAWTLKLDDHFPPMPCRNASVCVLEKRENWRVVIWNQTPELP